MLKDALTSLQTVVRFVRSYSTSTFSVMYFDENYISHVPVRKRRQWANGLGFQISHFYWSFLGDTTTATQLSPYFSAELFHLSHFTLLFCLFVGSRQATEYGSSGPCSGLFVVSGRAGMTGNPGSPGEITLIRTCIDRTCYLELSFSPALSGDCHSLLVSKN